MFPNTSILKRGKKKEKKMELPTFGWLDYKGASYKLIPWLLILLKHLGVSYLTEIGSHGRLLKALYSADFEVKS